MSNSSSASPDVAAALLSHALRRALDGCASYITPSPELVVIQPHAQKAFDLLVDHVEKNAPLPPSQCIPKGGAISGNPDQAGNCAQLLVP
ncbi:MAG TPA: hypothetical protein VF059_04845 [Casimicrobiaceae bacterium]